MPKKVYLGFDDVYGRKVIEGKSYLKCGDNTRILLNALGYKPLIRSRYDYFYFDIETEIINGWHVIECENPVDIYNKVLSEKNNLGYSIKSFITLIEKEVENKIYKKKCYKCSQEFYSYSNKSKVCGKCNKLCPYKFNYKQYPDRDTILRDKQILKSLKK